MNGLTDEQVLKVIAALHSDPQWARQLIHQFTKENRGINYRIDTSLYSWQYSDGSSELVDEMSVDNLRQAICSCMDFVEEIQNREANQRDIDDWMQGNYPGPKYIKLNPIASMVKATLASDQSESRKGWVDNAMDAYYVDRRR